MHGTEDRRPTQGGDGQLVHSQASPVEAYVAVQQNEHARCRRLLRTALEIASQQRYVSHSYWCPRIMARLYAEALQHHIAVGHVRGVIRQHRLLPASPDIENWPLPVRIYTLGPF